MKERILEMLKEAPNGLRKHFMFSPANVEGHKAIAELLEEGKIREERHRDMANMEDFIVYFLNVSESTYKCPLEDYDCPYYDEDGFCRLGEDAIEECADAADFESIFGEDEEDLRYIADWEDEEADDDFIMFEADEFFRTLAEMPEDF